MTAKVFTLKEWYEAMEKSKDETRFNGVSPGGAANRLGVTRQTIYNLLKRDQLDRITIVDSDGDKLAVLITMESLIRYKHGCDKNSTDLFASAG